MTNDTDFEAKRELYKTAKWEGEYVRLIGFYGTGPRTTWKIKTIGGTRHLVDQIELSEFCL